MYFIPALSHTLSQTPWLPRGITQLAWYVAPSALCQVHIPIWAQLWVPVESLTSVGGCVDLRVCHLGKGKVQAWGTLLTYWEVVNQLRGGGADMTFKNIHPKLHFSGTTVYDPSSWGSSFSWSQNHTHDCFLHINCSKLFLKNSSSQPHHYASTVLQIYCAPTKCPHARPGISHTLYACTPVLRYRMDLTLFKSFSLPVFQRN